MAHAVVAGGGIGGLAAAAGLHRIGWDVTVLERADRFGDVGAGISLWPNALRCLDELGVDLSATLRPQQDGSFRAADGRHIATWEAGTFERLHGLPLTAIHRADLIDGLKAALPARSLHTGAEVTEVTPSGFVRFTGGSVQADVVVAADGIRSTIRRSLLPDHPGPVYSGSTAFRGVAPREAGFGTTMGPGTEIGMLPLRQGTYWWISYVTQPGVQHEDRKAYLLQRFGGWHDPIPALVEATGEILHHDLDYLATPLRSFVHGRVVFLGDAAHAMPPALGQGGCQALEDAVVLAAELSTSDVPGALAAYDAQRRPRAQRVVRRSVQAGRFGPQLRNPLAVAVRTALIKRLPAKALIRLEAGISSWRPPGLSRSARPRRR